MKTSRLMRAVFVFTGSLLLVSLFSTQIIHAEANGETYAWNSLTDLPVVRQQLSTVAYNGYLYAIGGDDGITNGGTSSVYYAPINPDGTIGSWILDPDVVFPACRHRHISHVVKGFLYIIGGNCVGGAQSSVYYAPVNPDGSIGTVTTTTGMPGGRRRMTSWVVNDYIFVAGGSNPGYNTVYSAHIEDDGTIASWSTETDSIPANRYHHASALYNNYAYVIGGYDELGIAHDTVYYAHINTDGTTEAWQTNALPLPTVLVRAQSFAINGYLYVVGGEPNTGTAQSTVYFAKLHNDGSTDAWQTSTRNLPAPRELFALALNGTSHAYVIGGDADGVFGSAVSSVYNVSLTPPVHFTTTTLPNALVGESYDETPLTGDGVSPISFVLQSGVLPNGIVLNPSTGKLNGIPTAVGDYAFTLRAIDSLSAFADRTFTITVLNDADSDGIPDDEERLSPLGTDVNNDSVPDAQQKIVATTLNTVNNTYISTVVNNCAGGFSRYISKPESNVADDSQYLYPHGLQDFTVNCGVAGTTANFTQYFDKVYDTAKWRYRKYMPTVGYLDITNLVTLSTATVNGIQVTVASYNVTDGSQYDADGLTDGNITDPLGAAVLASSSLANTGLNTIVLMTIAGALSIGSVFWSLGIIKKRGI